jgi:serine protease Do
MKKILGPIFCFIILSGCVRERYVNVAEEVLPACVEISVTGTVETFTLEDLLMGKPPQVTIKRVLGSGVFINDKGYILTCAHLFTLFTQVTMITVERPTGDVSFGTLKMMGQGVDLALVSIDSSKTPYAKLADPRMLKVGQEVIAIGSPLGLPFSVTNGIISALHRDIEKAYNVTQSNTAINPGNSGGPLFNLKGELVGINSFMASPVKAPIFTGLGFSVQSGQILEFLVNAGRKYPEVKNKKWIHLLYQQA